MAKYRCPKCGSEADIDLKNKTMNVRMMLKKPPQSGPDFLPSVASFNFPSHPDCQFGKPITEIDFTRLEKIEEAS